MTGSLFEEDLPGEQPVAQYRAGELTLTNLRVRYRGRGRARNRAAFVRLRDVTAVSVGRNWGFQPLLLLVPAGVFLAFFALALMVEQEDPIFVGFFVSLFLVPVMFLFMRAPDLQIATPGGKVAVRVPKRLLSEARTFINELEAARHALDAEATPTSVERPMPTATPWVR